MKSSELTQDMPLTSCRGHLIKQREGESSDSEQLTPRTANRDTSLMRAASDGDLNHLQRILSTNSELLGQQNKPGKTALMLAAERGHYECAKALLQEAGITTPSNTTALMFAVRAHCLSIIELLAPLEGTMSGMTPLIQAIIAGPISDSTVITYSSYLGRKDRCGMSALMYSALFCKPESINLLLKGSINNAATELSLVNSKQETALMLATKQNCPKCVAQLLDEAGYLTRNRRSAALIAMDLPTRNCADLLLSSEKERSTSGVTKLMVDARYGESMSDSVLTDNRQSALDGKTALIHAAISNNLEMVRILKEKEAKMQDRLGFTALMYAIRNKNMDIVSELAQYEAGAISKSGETALFMAIESEFSSSIPLLLPYEINITTEHCPNLILYSVRRKQPNITIMNILVSYYINHNNKKPFISLRRPAEGFWRETALIYAATIGDKALIEKNLTQIGQMYRGNTALLKAVEGNRPDCIPLLLGELGIQVWDGQTALMRACELGRTDCINLLLAESYATTASGTTALMKASMANKPEAVRLLLHEAGLQDTDGRTALIIAAQRNYREIVEILVDYEKSITDKESKTALVYAILNKALDCIETLLKSEEEFTQISSLMVDVSLGRTISIDTYRLDLGKFDIYGNTALMYALMAKNYSGAQALLEFEGGMQNTLGKFALLLVVDLQDIKGIEIVTQCSRECFLYDENGDTALTYAIKRKLRDSIHALAGLLFTTPTNNGTLPIDIALAEGNGEAYAILYSLHLEKCKEFILLQKPLPLKKVDEQTELLRAVERNDLEGVRAHLNKIGYMFQGRSSLFKAAELGNIDILHILLCESRNANLIGETALILATLAGNQEVVRLLAPLETGISGFNKTMVCAALDDFSGLIENINESAGVTDILGNTALVYASACGSLKCVKYLLNMEVGKESGRLTPLMAAARNNKVDVVKLLLKQTKYYGQQDILGMTALMHAVERHARDVARLLLSYEATFRNAFGETAFDIARKHNVSLLE